MLILTGMNISVGIFNVFGYEFYHFIAFQNDFFEPRQEFLLQKVDISMRIVLYIYYGLYS